MRKLLFLVLLVLTVFAANVFAVDIDLGFGLGCIVTKIKGLDDLTDGVVREQFPVRLKLKNGDIDRLMFNVDCLFGVSENVKIGPRIAFLRNSADLTLPDWVVYKDQWDVGKWYMENNRRIIPGEHPIYFQASAVLVPVMLGGSYNQKINKEFSLNTKLFLGVGFINTTTCQYDGDLAHDNTCRFKSESDLMMLPNTSVKKSARCFVANPSIGVQYDTSKDARVGLDVGYLYTPATKSGFKDTKLDFSGFTVNLCFTARI
ncbi:hypothetical protein AGMMS50233_11030 [Endomicrobiia bacterium]|nr:hypothetical protein AGMMS50233_11030 [Endomicrobiia bacterium]